MAELRQRAVKWTDADWREVQKHAKEAGKTAAEWVRERTVSLYDFSQVNPVIANLTAERDAALKLAKLTEENAARAEEASVRIAIVPLVDTVAVLEGMEARILERATALGMTPDEWLRGLVELTLERPIAPSKAASKTVREPSTKHLERDPSSRFASLKVAPADSPNVKWRLGEEPGPPAWMTAPTTKPGMTRDQALGAGMEAARIVMGGKAA